MEQEQVDDGDVRPAALFRLPRPARAPEWRRWAAFGLACALLGAALALLWARMEFNGAAREMLAPKNERMDHGGVPR